MVVLSINNSSKRYFWAVSIYYLLPVICLAAQLVEVSVSEAGDMERLMQTGLAVMYVTEDQTADVILYTDFERRLLEQSGLRFSVTHENLEEFYLSRMGPARDDIAGYRTFDEICDELNQLHEDFPDIISEPISIGESLEGRPLMAVKISDNPEENEDEPEVLMTAMIHSDEMIGGEVLFGLINHLTENYGNDERITRLVDEREIWLLPCHNPDGLVFCEEQFNIGEPWLWRLNRRVHPDNRIGVDLNRNYGYMWAYDNIGSRPSSRGANAFSEPETQAVRDFVIDHNFSISLFFHACGSFCMFPLNYEYIFPPHRGLFSCISDKLTAQNRYVPGTSWECMYKINGGSDDWLYMSEEHEPIMAFTIEIGTREDGHAPPRERVEPLVNENLELCLTAIDYADNPGRALPPPSVEDVNVDLNENDNPVIHWDIPEDENNPPQAFNVLAREQGEEYTDDAEEDNDIWELLNTFRTSTNSHSERYSYFFDNRLRKGYYLTIRNEIIAPDTLSAWLTYQLSYPLFFQVSLDGYNWVSLPGSDTEDFFVEDYNHGPGITGQSGNWRRCWWSFGEYAGQMVKIRFCLLRLGPRAQDHCYIDDIGPLPTTEWGEVIVEDIEESPFIDEEREPDPEVEYLVQSIDPEGDRSFWSIPGRIDFPDTIRVQLEDGWNLISINVSPPQEFYRHDEERGPHVVYMLEQFRIEEFPGYCIDFFKDGSGRFFSPEFGFFNIPFWNSTEGYLAKMDGDFEAVWLGERIPANADIPLIRRWNMIAYYPTYELDASAHDYYVLSPIIDHVEVAKDGDGNFMLPAFNFSNMPPWRESQGYMVKVDANVVLNYPEVER